MKRIRTLVLGVILVSAACSSSAGTATQTPAGPNPAASPIVTQPPAAAGDLRFTITFTFDDRSAESAFWHTGEFTTTGTVSMAVINALSGTRGGIGTTWPASGKQQFGDYFCHTEDECLDPCVGSFDGAWRAEPEIGIIERSGPHLVLDVQLHANPPAGDDTFLTSAGDCPPSTNGGVDTFPPMHITVDGLGSGTPTYSIEPYEFDGIPPPPAGTVWKLAIQPA
jgi:hypothetical protein